MTIVTKVLEVSTAHIPMEVAQAIDEGYFCRKPAMQREEGWLFHVPEEPTPPGEGLESKAFDAVMSRARAEECDWLLFDRDVPISIYLPTFDW